MFTWLPVLFITHVIKLSVISELVWSLSCYSLNFSPSNDQTTEHGELNDLPRGVRIPKGFSHPSQDSFIPSSCWKCSLRNLFSVVPSASVLLGGCPTKCCKLQTRVHTCTPPHLGSSRLLVEHVTHWASCKGPGSGLGRLRPGRTEWWDYFHFLRSGRLVSSRYWRANTHTTQSLLESTNSHWEESKERSSLFCHVGE